MTTSFNYFEVITLKIFKMKLLQKLLIFGFSLLFINCTNNGKDIKASIEIDRKYICPIPRDITISWEMEYGTDYAFKSTYNDASNTTITSLETKLNNALQTSIGNTTANNDISGSIIIDPYTEKYNQDVVLISLEKDNSVVGFNGFDATGQGEMEIEDLKYTCDPESNVIPPSIDWIEREYPMMAFGKILNRGDSEIKLEYRDRSTNALQSLVIIPGQIKNTANVQYIRDIKTIINTNQNSSQFDCSNLPDDIKVTIFYSCP